MLEQLDLENGIYLPEIFEEVKNKKARIGVAVEGGGLRGIVSATLLQILDEHDMRSRLKAISGTSSGAINAAYFLNNKMDSLFRLYEKMASKDFIQPWRWPNAMNLPFLFEEQVPKHHPLDWKLLRNHPIPFFISVTDIENGKSEFHQAQSCKTDAELFATIRASASAPLFCTNSETIGDRTFNDGHIHLAIPIGCFNPSQIDIVFCLLTREKGYKKKNTFSSWLLEKMALRHQTEAYQLSFSNSSQTYNDQIKTIEKEPLYLPIAIEPSDHLISKTCRNPEELHRCISSTRDRFLKPL
ncbi:MAG: patatin-like phospholipase family protein [Pseudomonadota bacterium]